MIRAAFRWLATRAERAGREPRRLSDGTIVALGMRVVKVESVLREWGLPHAYDAKTHIVTSLLDYGSSRGSVELGPEQVALAALRRAPHRVGATCRACVQWPETLRRLREVSVP